MVKLLYNKIVNFSSLKEKIKMTKFISKNGYQWVCKNQHRWMSSSIKVRFCPECKTEEIFLSEEEINKLNETIGVKVSKTMLNQLKKISRKESYEKDRDISVSYLIRKAIEKTYPMEK